MMLMCDDVIHIIPDRYPSLYGLWRGDSLVGIRIMRLPIATVQLTSYEVHGDD